ncbi:MAG: hypothetical protein KJZ64_02085 [Sphingomonadaceae bacterium]|nr:hypothetical protein [Sphingomonadaceae bacterium]
MPLNWNCLEPLTAIGIGIGACALAPLDMGLAAAGVIGGSGLLARIKENSRKAGLEDDKLIARMQKQLLGKLDHWDSHAERVAVARADEAMNRLLPQVMLTREQLAATATMSGESAERYPVLAARLVVAELAHHDAMFAEPGAGAPASAERLFALEAVEAALRTAKNDPAYATLLTLDIAIELGRAQAETLAGLREVANQVDTTKGMLAEHGDLLRQIVANQKMQTASQGVNLLALAEPLVGRVVDPLVAEQALSDAIGELMNLRSRIKVGANVGIDIENDLGRILELIESDEIDAAEKLGDHAFQRIDSSMCELWAARQQLARTNLSVARLRYDPKKAAYWALELQKSEIRAERLEYAQIHQNALVSLLDARRSGRLIDLEVAVEISRVAVRRSKDRIEKVGSRQNLVNGLNQLAQRHGGNIGIELLKESELVAREAVRLVKKSWGSGVYAAALIGLADVLAIRGMIKAGKDGENDLRESLKKYDIAIANFPDGILPEKNAAIRHSKGIAQSSLGIRISGNRGFQLLKSAIISNESALELISLNKFPEDWASISNSLAGDLATMGQRVEGEEGLEFLSRAIDLYREVLIVANSIGAPNLAASVASNLGASLSARGRRCGVEAGLDDLEEGLSILQDLRSADREEIGARARVQILTNIGQTEEAIGDRADSAERTIRYRLAEIAYLEAFEKVKMSNHSAAFQELDSALSRVRLKKLAIN